MTSGTFTSIPIDSIIINREARQRRDLGDINELTSSIAARGLINPITVTRDNILVAGERRLTACRSLSWTHIHAHYCDQLEPLELQAIELEENIKRSELSWQDRTRAIAQFHSVKSAQAPAWNQEQTARELGMSIGNVNKYIAVERHLGDEKIASAQRFSVALGLVERRTERARSEGIAHIKESTPGPRREVAVVECPYTIRNASFLDWSKEYDGPPFNFIHCDFPYGINADNIKQGSAVAKHGGYSDSRDVYFELIESLLSGVSRIASDSCHLMFWFSMEHYHATYELLSQHFTVDKFPLIWMKTDNVGLLPDPSRGPRRIYETAFYGSRGDRKIVQAVGNAYGAPTVRNLHMSEKPEPMLRHFFRMFVDQHSRVLDPTAGSGSAIRAAEAMKAQSALGLELNPDFARDAQAALEKSIKLKGVAP